MNNETMLALLCAALYLLVAINLYSKLKYVIRLKIKEIEDEYMDGLEQRHKIAVAKTSAMIVSLFWPISVVASRFYKDKK